MIKYLRIIWSAVKNALRSVNNSILHGRYFPGVEFHNQQNIIVHERSSIDPGTRLLVTQPVIAGANIVIEEQCWLGRDVELQTNYDSKIVIKKNVSIQDRCKILGSVHIGSDSLLAPDVFISSGNHYYDHIPELPIKQQDKLAAGTIELFNEKNRPVEIEEDCWLGKNSIIMRGVNVGRGAIIGANSLVNKNVPPYEIWSGSPAKLIKKRLNFNPDLSIQSDRIECIPYFYRGFDHNDKGADGIMSNNTSICILAVSDKNFLLLTGKIHAGGHLKIWANESLTFNEQVAPGDYKQELKLRQTSDSKQICELYNNLQKGLKQYLCIIFEFNPKDRQILKGFSIKNIVQK